MEDKYERLVESVVKNARHIEGIKRHIGMSIIIYYLQKVT